MTMTMETGRRVRYGGRDEESGTTSTFESVRRLWRRRSRSFLTINEEMDDVPDRPRDDARARGASGESGREWWRERWWVRVSRRARAHVAETQGGVAGIRRRARTWPKADAEEALDRERLLGGARGGQEGSSEESMEARLIRERARVAGSTSAVDDIIGAGGIPREQERSAARYKTSERN